MSKKSSELCVWIPKGIVCPFGDRCRHSHDIKDSKDYKITTEDFDTIDKTNVSAIAQTKEYVTKMSDVKVGEWYYFPFWKLNFLIRSINGSTISISAHNGMLEDATSIEEMVAEKVYQIK